MSEPDVIDECSATRSASDECKPVSRLGLGTGRLASLGTGNTLRTAQTLVEAAFCEGITLIDTADTYGSSDCESWLGQVLQPFKNAFCISTKAGCRFAEFPRPLSLFNQIGKKALRIVGARPRFDSAYLTRCIEGSLRRLRRERLDIFLLHDPPLEAVSNAEWEPAIMAAKRAGKIGRFGISSPSLDVLRYSAASATCEVLQLPLVIAAAVSGVAPQSLIVNHVSGAIGDHPAIATMAAQLRLEPRSLLLGYAGSLSGVSSVLTGTRSAEHLRENKQAVERKLPAGVRARLDRILR